MNDLEAVKAIKNGNKMAFKHLFDRYYNRLVAYIVTYTHDHDQSEEIVQQAFINLWEDRNKLSIEKSPRNYLYAIAYNRFVDSFKKAKRREQLLDDLWEKSLRDRIVEDNEQLEKRIEKIKQIINSLPPKCRKVIQLNKREGLKYTEIAEQMGITVKTVESQMRIAFKKIREGFKKNSIILFLFKRHY
ncbi:MAG: RNA polymerase sigma-70 factor [Flavobacteriaceae bacterium]|nr:RNA polymerase sigma-70 factor [Flavobacteriaceae bacterium]